MQGCEPMCIGSAVAHFLNCLLGACQAPAVSAGPAPGGGRGAGRGGRGRKSRKHNSHAPPSPLPDWQNLTPKALFSQIKHELKVRFLMIFYFYDKE